MNNPCRWCVAPERHPGCHDHCEKLQAYHNSDEYRKLCEYKMKYFDSRGNFFNTSTYNDILHMRQRMGKKVMNYRTRPWGD